MRHVILNVVKNLGVVLFLCFVLRVSPVSAAITSRLTIPVAGNATLVLENKNGADSQTAVISDSISSTKAILSSDGTTTETPQYYPYGTSLASQSYQTDQTYQSNPTNRYYTGQRKIPDDNLYNYNARYYNPDTGVFTQPDSVQGLNRFAYVSGNPILNNDPTGHIVGPNRGNSDYPKDADPIKNIGTFIGVNLKTTGILDLASLAYRGYAVQHGYGILADDPISSYSRSLNHYVSRSSVETVSALAMIQPMSAVGDVERLGSTESTFRLFKLSEKTVSEVEKDAKLVNPYGPDYRIFEDGLVMDEESIDLKEAINRALDHPHFNPREAAMTRAHFGLSDMGAPQSYREIAEDHGINASGVARIVVKAVRKLRHPVHSKELIRYIYK